MLNVAPEVEELFEQTRQVVLELPEAEENTHWGTCTFSREIKGNNFLFLYPKKDCLELLFKIPAQEKEAALKLPFIEKNKGMEQRSWLLATVKTPEELAQVLPMLRQSYAMSKPFRGPADALPGENPRVLEMLEAVRQAAHKYDDVEEYFPSGTRAFRPRKGQLFLYASESDDWLNVNVRLPFGEREYALTLPNVEVPKYIGHKGWVAVQVHDQDDLNLVLSWIAMSFDENRPKRKPKKVK
jgi:predicted DNA-binding protein (MmcQ/YjbR family)